MLPPIPIIRMPNRSLPQLLQQQDNGKHLRRRNRNEPSIIHFLRLREKETLGVLQHLLEGSEDVLGVHLGIVDAAGSVGAEEPERAAVEEGAGVEEEDVEVGSHERSGGIGVDDLEGEVAAVGVGVLNVFGVVRGIDDGSATRFGSVR